MRSLICQLRTALCRCSKRCDSAHRATCCAQLLIVIDLDSHGRLHPELTVGCQTLRPGDAPEPAALRLWPAEPPRTAESLRPAPKGCEQLAWRDPPERLPMHRACRVPGASCAHALLTAATQGLCPQPLPPCSAAAKSTCLLLYLSSAPPHWPLARLPARSKAPPRLRQAREQLRVAFREASCCSRLP